MSELRSLIEHVPQTGRLEWIGLRPARREPVTAAEAVRVTTEHGLDGDHYRTRTGSKGSRQVSLIQAEHLPVVAALTGREEVAPELVRRNLLVSGINLASLKDLHFRIGEVEFVGTGPCTPCSRMDEVLGAGGFQAMRGHGGLLARVVREGTIRVGDVVQTIESPTSSSISPSAR